MLSKHFVKGAIPVREGYPSHKFTNICFCRALQGMDYLEEKQNICVIKQLSPGEVECANMPQPKSKSTDRPEDCKLAQIGVPRTYAMVSCYRQTRVLSSSFKLHLHHPRCFQVFPRARVYICCSAASTQVYETLDAKLLVLHFIVRTHPLITKRLLKLRTGKVAKNE